MSMEHWQSDSRMGQLSTQRKTPPSATDHHKSHMGWPGIKYRPTQ